VRKHGVIASIQDYSIKDGPGLRTTVFLKGCNLQCGWCSNPEAMHTGSELFFFPERIKDADLALAENPGALARTDGRWEVDRSRLGTASDVLDRNTVRLFEVVGERTEAQECARRLLRNKAFYEASGGGVTFSGGEAMLQADFVDEVERLLAAENVHLAIDTAGHVPWSAFEKVLPRTDLFLFDIKTADSDLHRRLTGVGNERILDNARRLSGTASEIWVRLVLIPGLNDMPTDLHRRLELAAEMGPRVTRVDLLGYHSLGVGKYHRLGRTYRLGKVPSPDQRILDDALAYAERLGLSLHYEPGLNA